MLKAARRVLFLRLLSGGLVYANGMSGECAGVPTMQCAGDRQTPRFWVSRQGIDRAGAGVDRTSNATFGRADPSWIC
jgi:hypothetical protein